MTTTPSTATAATRQRPRRTRGDIARRGPKPRDGAGRAMATTTDSSGEEMHRTGVREPANHEHLFAVKGQPEQMFALRRQPRYHRGSNTRLAHPPTRGYP